jgi:hypothetical protein
MKNVREQYLEYRYGLRPLYYELKGVHDYLKNEICHDRQTSRGYSNVQEVVNQDVVIMDTYVEPWTTVPRALITFSRDNTVDVTCRAGELYNYQFSGNIHKFIAELGVDRPISSVWELVPFSFMIDWFWRCGDTFRAWEPKPGCKTLASWLVTTEKSVSTIIPTGITYTDIGSRVTVDNSELTTPTAAVLQKITKTRMPNPELSVFPPTNVRLDLAKLTDMAAIFWGLKESKRRQRW